MTTNTESLFTTIAFIRGQKFCCEQPTLRPSSPLMQEVVGQHLPGGVIVDGVWLGMSPRPRRYKHRVGSIRW